MNYYQDMNSDKAFDTRAFGRKRVLKGDKMLLRREKANRGTYRSRSPKDHNKEYLNKLVKKIN